METTTIIESVEPSEQSEGAVASRFRRLVSAGAKLLPAGSLKDDPARLLRLGYTPRHRVELFGCDLFLCNLRRDEDFRYFVAYLRPADDAGRSPQRTRLYPRIVYKDSSLIWRCASHFIDSDRDQWIGKGDLKEAYEDGEPVWSSAEETTNLPLELQAALDTISRRGPRGREDRRAIERIVRRAPEHRIAPYADFSAPRRRAMARVQVNGGDDIAWFEDPGDPGSLRFAAGFEPDFRRGLIDSHTLRSRLYGGEVRRYRILSRNREIQYGFVAGPRQVWILPAQTLTTELSTYVVRTVDVHADEKLYLPGFEFHFLDKGASPPRLHSQIPEGFAGAPSDIDPSRADTSPWNDRLPVIRRFRKHFPRHA